MEVGDRSTIAVEMNGVPRSQDGFIILYVNGQGFGNVSFSYDVGVALMLLDEVMRDADYYAPELLALGVAEFVDLVNCMYEDSSDPRFTKFEPYFEKLDMHLIVRYGYYAFDRCLLGMVAGDAEERIFLVDEDDGRMESRILPVGTVHKLVKQARAEWDAGVAPEVA